MFLSKTRKSQIYIGVDLDSSRARYVEQNQHTLHKLTCIQSKHYMMPTKKKHDIDHDDDECLHCYDDESDEENMSNCGCGFIGFKKSQVFDYNFSSEIEEDDDSEDELFEINLKKEALDSIREEEEECESSTVFSLDIHKDKLDDDVVYVAVGESTSFCSSMEALSWALKHSVIPNFTIISLIHVFPQAKLIPTPLGKMPRNHVNQEHINIYLTQEKTKRKILLQKFIDLCIDSKVKVEVLLIEGNNVAKAIMDLVAKLNMRKLVMGTTQSNLRKHVSRRQKSISDMVLKTVQESCDVKIICEGKEVIDEMINGCTSQYSKDNRNKVDESHGLVPLKGLMPNLFWSRYL